MIKYTSVFWKDSYLSKTVARVSEALSFYQFSTASTVWTRSHSDKKPPIVFCGVVFVCMLLAFISTTPVHAANQLKAFACAEGFGAFATGGRGGDVYHVTKLTDDFSVGTLRHGIISATGPRTIVFDLGGYIKLNSWLNIRNDQITLAGQTAPGGGIAIIGYPLGIVDASDIIIRHMRFRVGDFNAADPNGGGNGKGNQDLRGEGGDAITVLRANNVMMDHLSASWSMDEVIGINESENLTLQHSLIAYSLNDSFNHRGPHSKGLLAYGNSTKQAVENGVGGYTFYRNLLAHHDNRSPLIGGKPPAWMGAEFINNVVYDWGLRSGHNGRVNIMMNYVNNYLIAGPSLRAGNPNIAMRKIKEVDGDFLIHYSGNYMDLDQDRNHDGQLVGDVAFNGFKENERLSERLPFPVINNVASAEAAYQKVLAESGASLVRDSIDRRAVDEVRKRSGGLINSPSDVGGLVALARGTAPIDSDKDGMPDNWEQQHGLDPNDAIDRNGTDLSSIGYTNLEVYLDSIVASAGLCDSGTPEAIAPPVAEEQVAATRNVTSNNTTTVLASILNDHDDAEEKKDTGFVVIRSIDLDLVRSGINQTVGLRFEGLNIPNGATIVNASIQFTTSDVRAEATSLILKGENTDNAAIFTNSIRNNISLRPKTTAAVSWSPAPWLTIDDANSDQQTPDLSSIIQEIVDRPGWSSNNALALIITGTGKRNAYSFKGDQSKVPVLKVEFQ